jgi:class 3 adenylate cyclase/tetratricopeptide (TPR) repeat protein
MESFTTYLPIDRCYAIFQGKDLPGRTQGATLFADISGFTPLTESLLRVAGPGRGAEELTHQLNQVYESLIPEVHRYGGSVIMFGGDAIICWFDGDHGFRAVACALAMQQAILRFASTTTPSGVVVSLAMKATIATGPARRLLVGDPSIQVMDVIAGATLDQVAAAERYASRGEVVVTSDTLRHLEGSAEVGGWHRDAESSESYAIVTGLTRTVRETPWPTVCFQPAVSEFEVQPWILPPVYRQLRAGQGQFLAEIRPAVALFLQFHGIDYDHNEAAGAHLDAYIRWVQNTLARYEGFLLQVIMGDKGSYLYASFGAPLAHDDDPSRAVAAALDLVAPPPELAFITGVQIGITRGLVHAGAYGSSQRRTYGVLGDEVNLAARLMAKAEPGHILVSGRIAYNTSHIYNFEPMGMVQVKGKQEPVPVSRVRSRKLPTQQQTNLLFTTALVGRDRELGQFDRILKMVLRERRGHIVRVEGSAGIGKSHLVAAFDKRAVHRGMQVLLGACQSISQNIAYAPWQQIFRARFGMADVPMAPPVPSSLSFASPSDQIARVEQQVAQINPDWLVRLPLLGDLLDLPIPDNPTTAAFEPRLRQEALFTLAVDLMRTWSKEQPILLVLEDIHWMDEASQGLTLALSRVLAEMPVLLTLVHRPPLHEDRPFLPELSSMAVHHAINLSELSSEGVQTLIADHLQAPISPLGLALIQAKAQGNPFFLEELVDALCETGRLVQQPDGVWTLSDAVIQSLVDARCLVKASTGEWSLAPNAPLAAVSLGLPDSVYGVVLSRIDRLPEEHKLTLKVASVIGRVFDIDLLCEIHPAHPHRDTLLEQVQMAESRDFTRLEIPPPRLTYIFKHSVTQEVAYDTLLESQRRDLHRLVGETLERLHPDAIEQMAYHYSRSTVRDKTLFYLDKVARKTQREYANETALAYYNQALALEERWEWRRGQIEVLHTMGRRQEQETALRALDVSPDAPVFVVASLWEQYYEATGDYAQAHASVERALADCRVRADNIGEACSLSHLGSIIYRQGDYDQARTWYLQALEQFQKEAAETYPDQAFWIFIETLNGLGDISFRQGMFDQAQGYFEQALHLSRARNHRKGEADVLNNLGGMFSYQQRFSEALTHYQQALELQRTIGDRSGEGASLGNVAQVIQVMGDYGRAGDYLSASLAIQQATGNRWNEVNDWNDLGLLHLELGDLPRAWECLQQGLSIGQDIGDEAGQAYILANLGLVAYEQGRLQEAETILSDGLELSQTLDDSYLVAIFLSYLGMVSLRANQVDRAIEQAEQALTIRRELDLPVSTTHNLATLAAAWLLRGDPATALDYARQSRAILDDCRGEGPETPQRDYFLCSQVLARAGEPEAAHATLRQAHELVMARAEKITDPALRHSFLERVPINRQIVEAVRQSVPADGDR